MKRELNNSIVLASLENSIATFFVGATIITLFVSTTSGLPIIGSFGNDFLLDSKVYALLTEPSPGQDAGEKLYENIDLVVIGKITNSSARLEDDNGGEIWTYMQVDVEKYLKNSQPDKNLTVKSMGGKAGNLGQWVEDSPIFNVGDKVLLLLNKDNSKNDAYIVSGQSVVMANDKSSAENLPQN